MVIYFYADSDEIDNQRTSWFRTPEAALQAFQDETQSCVPRDLRPYIVRVVDPTSEQIEEERQLAGDNVQANELPQKGKKMKMRLETVKGNYESESLRELREWLEQMQPSFASVILPSKTGEYNASLRTDLDTAEAWLDALAQVILDVYESGEYDLDAEMPNRLAFHGIAARIEQTQEECSTDAEDIETLIRMAGHDLHRETL
jgi:hypothetical protein